MPPNIPSNKVNSVVIADATLAQIGVDGSIAIVLSVYNAIEVSYNLV